MAAGKENEAPAAPSVAVAARRHAVAVRRCGLKKRPAGKRLLSRVPLRDITNLVAVCAAATELELLQELVDLDQLAKPDPVLPPATAVRGAVAGGTAAKAARYSLRKEFRKRIVRIKVQLQN
ncbi:hypothetical protein EJB05_42112, partial [Eragrostis curvula]